MATTSPPSSAEPSVTQLVAGALDDAQNLLQQQLALFKLELREDAQNAKSGATLIGTGLGILLVGAILAAQLLVVVLQTAFPELPAWVCYAIPAFCICLIGGICVYSGQRRLANLRLAEQSIKSLKENVQWMQNPK